MFTHTFNLFIVSVILRFFIVVFLLFLSFSTLLILESPEQRPKVNPSLWRFALLQWPDHSLLYLRLGHLNMELYNLLFSNLDGRQVLYLKMKRKKNLNCPLVPEAFPEF